MSSEEDGGQAPGKRAFALPESQGNHRAVTPACLMYRGFELFRLVLNLKASENHWQERHLRGTCYSSPGSNTTPQRASDWHWTRFSAASERSPGLQSEKLVSRYPAGQSSGDGLSPRGRSTGFGASIWETPRMSN